MAKVKTISTSRPGTTWLGRPGKQTIYLLTSNPVGLRVVEHQWADEKVARVSIVDGDGRSRMAKTYVEWFGAEPGQGEALFVALGGSVA